MKENSGEMEINKPIPEGKKRFEMRMHPGKNGSVKQGVFIDGELLDWSVEVADIFEARKMGPKFMQSVKMDIVRHFLQSVSEFLNRKVSVEELNEAKNNGYI